VLPGELYTPSQLNRSEYEKVPAKIDDNEAL